MFSCFMGRVSKNDKTSYASQNEILSFKNLYYSQLWSYSVFTHNLTITTCVALLWPI